jgi:hypothetical protein
MARMVFAAAVGLIALAVPGYSSTLLSFQDSSTDSGGSVTLSGSTVASITGALINQLMVGSTDYTITGGTLSTCSGSADTTGCGSSTADTELVLNGSVTIGTHTLNETLATITLTSALTETQGAGQFVINLNNISSIVFGSNLLSDLGIVPSSPTAFTGNVNGTVSGSTLTPNSNSVEAAVTLAPEPSSWLLMGTALLGFAFFARRKAFQRN